MTLLKGKKVAILVETEYIHDEIAAHHNFFTSHGAEVDLITYLWGQPEREIVSDVTEPDTFPKTITVTKDFDTTNPNDYAIVIVAANYVACRLREIMPMGSLGSTAELRTPPAVRFFAAAMMNKNIVKGALCHALWLLTPVPELLKDRKVICHTVVLADIYNAGGIFVPDPSHVVIDDDLVTGRSAEDLKAYQKAMLLAYKQINKISNE